MELPNRDKAWIPAPKLTDYLLNESHPVGGAKARFFRAHGFNDLNVSLLEQDLLEIAHTGTVDEVETIKHGVKYAINGSPDTPSGRIVLVRTVWFIPHGATDPQFITTYPM